MSSHELLYKKFSIGYNARSDFFEKIITKYHKYIASVYSAPAKSMKIKSCRGEPDILPKNLLKFRKQIEKYNISFNLLFNFDGLNKPNKSFLKKVYKVTKFLKPDVITVSNSFMLDFFIKYTDFKLNLSVINDINSINQLDILFQKDQKKQIVSYNIGRRKTYDLDYIFNVKKRYPYVRLKLLINEGCLFECPDQNFHSCSISMGYNINNSFDNDNYVFLCEKLKPDEHWRFLSGQYIPPKFLMNFINYVDEFKISSRGTPSDNLSTIMQDYIFERDITIFDAMMKSEGGSLFRKKYLVNNSRYFSELSKKYNVPYPVDFFKRRIECKNNCYTCSYCKNILE